MRRLSLFVVLLALWPLCAPAYPQGLFSSPLNGKVPGKLQSMQHRFSQSGAVELHFRQAKHLPELKQPLVSSGVLIIAPRLGVDWRVTKPFASEWTVTRGGRVVKGPNNGAPKAVASLLMGLFSADIHKLRSAFKLYWTEQPPGWWLGLKPRNARLQQAISTIAVAGARGVHQVEVDESGGDRTLITFSGRQSLTVTPALRKRFSAK